MQERTPEQNKAILEHAKCTIEENRRFLEGMKFSKWTIHIDIESA